MLERKWIVCALVSGVSAKLSDKEDSVQTSTTPYGTVCAKLVSPDDILKATVAKGAGISACLFMMKIAKWCQSMSDSSPVSNRIDIALSLF
jgi:hypothetical protein